MDVQHRTEDTAVVPGLRIAIVGSRDHRDTAFIRNVVQQLYRRYGEFIFVSGGAKGVDSIAQAEARRLGCRTTVYKPEWGRFGKVAGYKRNRTIVENSDLVICLYAGPHKSNGTYSTFQIARLLKKEVHEALGRTWIKTNLIID